MKTKKLLPLLFCLFIFVSYNAFANHITVTNVLMTEQNTTAGVNNPANYTMIQFDISWENSWRISTDASNWDAAWVFIKYRIGSGEWQHTWLNNTGHYNPSGSTINTGLINPASPFDPSTNPGIGAFIFRDANDNGTFSKTGVKLRWNYGANGVPDDANVNLKVFAIEMVYVPQGPFYVGSGGSEYCAFYKYPTPANAYQITNEDEITVGIVSDNLYYNNDGGYAGDQSGPIPAAFPKGFNAFYCMKYEIMQQQYVDFLNTLTPGQASERFPNMNGNFRHAITVSSGVYSTGTQYVACNYLSEIDVKAYLDWSGLRPMTELEFEKSCRGTQPVVYQEYAFGTGIGGIIQNTGITNPGAYNETSTNNGNCTYNNGVPGPMRVGAFATSTSTRVESGATYYGIMEMSGNLWERTITVSQTVFRVYTGNHGNGMLAVGGNADVAWPYLGFRGGSWNDINLSFVKVSDRYYAAYETSGIGGTYGGRGVRSAP